MGFFDIFRRAPAIREAAALADFIDDNAAFLIQKGMYEYSRARAGHYAKVLMREPEFLAAIEKSRWQGFPLGLAMVGEMVEKVINPADWRTIGAPASMRSPTWCCRCSTAIRCRRRSARRPGPKRAHRARAAPRPDRAASAQAGEGHPGAVRARPIST